MEIAPQNKFSRIRILQHVFLILSRFYQQKGDVVAWAMDSNRIQMCPDYLWDRYALDVDSVRSNFMYTEESRLDRHKIIALTERIILEVQPLIFVGESFSSDDHYRLNAEYAVSFGIQFLTRWHEVYHREPFYPDRFLADLLKTDTGYSFFQEHLKLLMSHSRESIPLFWASQLWFLLEQWSLTHMRSHIRATCVDESRTAQSH